LADHARHPGWVAEDADAHLWPVAEVEVVTGSLDDETPFASHGHPLRLHVTFR
jgi:hypothetical protein